MTGITDRDADRATVDGSFRSLPHALTNPAAWYWSAMLLASVLFIHSTLTGGPTWDELLDFGKLAHQLSFARDAWSGGTGRSFHSMPGDAPYYGIGTVLLPYAASYLIDVAWLKEAIHGFDRIYSVLLHLVTFLCAIVAVSYVRRLVLLATGKAETAFLAGVALLTTPFWLGYGFFDYKDIPVATGVIAATYYGAAYLRDGGSRTSLCFFLALLFLGIQKSADLPLVMPACVAVLAGALRSREASIRHFAVLTAQAAVFLLLLYVATPPAWREPMAFAVDNLTYMTQHAWGGCTLTAGECVGRDFQDGRGYSVLTYLGLWYGVKLPILLWIGLLVSIGLYVRSFRRAGSVQHLVMAALAWPIVAIAVRNSTLYDGIRHTLFLVPLGVVITFVTIPETIWSRWRGLLACYFLLLFADAVALQPYQYVWFNEVARFVASEENFETDFWGFSMRQAALHARELQDPDDWVVSPKRNSNPAHLAGLVIAARFSTDVASVPPGATYFLVSLTRRNTKPPEQCVRVDYVTRHQLLAPAPLHLAFVCEMRK